MSSTTEQNVPESRSRRIDTRFSSAELALVEKVARWRGLPPSAFVRGAALAAAEQAQGHGHGHDDGAIKLSESSLLTAEHTAVLDAARVEVKRVGVNLNQLTRLGHQGVIDLGALASVVEELAEQHQRMVDALGGKGQS